MLAEICILGGLVWSYCSVACQQKDVHKTLKQVEERLQDCEDCLDAPGPRQITPNPSTTSLSPTTSTSSFVEDCSTSRQEISFPQPIEENENTCRNRSNPGKITNNSFFNFMREIRKCRSVNCVDAAKLWCALSDAEKMKYRIEEYVKRN